MNASFADIASDIIEWLASDYCHDLDLAGLVEGLGVRLTHAGVPLDRLVLHLLTIDPELIGRVVAWAPGEAVEIVSRRHGFEQTVLGRRNPVRYVLDSGAWLTIRTDHPDGDQWPFHDVYAGRGLIERIFAPLLSGTTQLGAISFSTCRPEGFKSEHLTLFRRIEPALRNVAELKALQERGTNLLGTYIGTETGRRIMAGHIRRGDVETIEAALMICDLRDFTGLSNRLPSDRVLNLLDLYFDQVVPAIAENGGEVLKFVGDAVLAFFRVSEDPSRNCLAALQAARSALARMGELSEPDAELSAGIALHYGTASYGNIGSGHRLDFTVIGRDVNLTSRIQAVCASTGESLLMSERFANLLPSMQVRSVGWHALKGFVESFELFTEVNRMAAIRRSAPAA